MTLLLFGSFVFFVIIRVPVVFSLALSCLTVLLWKGETTLMLLAQRTATGLDSFPLLAVPLFILMGEILNRGGCGQKLVTFSERLVGGITGEGLYLDRLGGGVALPLEKCRRIQFGVLARIVEPDAVGKKLFEVLVAAYQVDVEVLPLHPLGYSGHQIIRFEARQPVDRNAQTRDDGDDTIHLDD